MATTLSNSEPKRSDYPNEYEYARAYAAWGNLREADRLAGRTPTQTNDDNPQAGRADGYNADGGYVVNISGTNGTSQTTGQKSNTAQIDDQFPGARKKNPLSEYSSSTYSISLYMVTAEFMNKFSVNDPPASLPTDSDGIFVIAQSGGINNSFDQRLLTKSRNLGRGEEGLDYYIEDLTITTTIQPSPTGLTTFMPAIAFKIVEPIGFSFLQSLAIASTRINGKSPLVRATDAPPNSMQQGYIIGIRFYGYDVDGKVVNPGTNSYVGSIPNTKTDDKSITERFFSFRVSDMAFKIDDKATIYSFTGQSFSNAAVAEKLNTVPYPFRLSGTTVDGALRGVNGNGGLMSLMNNKSMLLVDMKKAKFPTEYDIEWIGGDDNPIAKSLIIDDTKVEKSITPMFDAATTSQTTIAGSLKSRTFNPSKHEFQFQAGTSMTEIIDNIIVKSSYISDSLNSINDGATETKNSESSSIKELNWYYINPVVELLGRDDILADWAYRIKFQIGVYKIPYIRTQYADTRSKYPGPFKVYNYIYTGENSEVLDFEQTYNNLYQSISAITAQESSYTKNTSAADLRKKLGNVPLALASSTNSSSIGGKLNSGSRINENVRAQLYNQSDQKTATIKILGDPDWIMTSIGVDQKISAQNNVDVGSKSIILAEGIAKQLYGTGYAINPYGGQTFIQIIFGIATDYQDNGLLDVGNDILFYDDLDVIKSGIQGFVYQVVEVYSSFSRGQFTQTFKLNFIPDPLLRTNQTSDSESREDPIDRARREAEDISANDEINSAIDNADWDATGKNINPLESYANDDRARQQNNATNTRAEGREVNRPNASNTRQTK